MQVILLQQVSTLYSTGWIQRPPPFPRFAPPIIQNPTQNMNIGTADLLKGHKMSWKFVYPRNSLYSTVVLNSVQSDL